MNGRILTVEEFEDKYVTLGEEHFHGLSPAAIQGELDQAHVIVSAFVNIDPERLPESDIYKVLISVYTKHRLCTQGLVKKDSVSAYLEEFNRLIKALRVKSFAGAVGDYQGKEDAGI